MEITPFQDDFIPQAAALFVQAYQRQRLVTPQLPEQMANCQHVEKMLAKLVGSGPAVAAVEGGRLVGYLGSYLVDGFRGTTRTGAYVPEWGHATAYRIQQTQQKTIVYRQLYRLVSAEWSAAGCQVHAITLLADDREAEKIWFWNGFGLAVVDAIRPMVPLEGVHSSGLVVRQATAGDADLLADLDAEHWQHYPRAPIFMPPHPGMDAAANASFISQPRNSVWLALDGETPIGFLRFDGYDFDSVAAVESDDGVLITGAYVRPAYRGRSAAAGLLQAALAHYARRGLKYCAVNFESFNPEAAAFWPRYFDPVCLSVVRVPET